MPVDEKEKMKEKIKETKTILNQYKNILQLIYELDNQIRVLDDKCKSIRSREMNGMPRGGKPITMVDILAEKEELERRRKKLAQEAPTKREVVQTYIDTVLLPKNNKILTLYYVNCLSIPEIAIKENYSTRHVFRLLSEGLEKVEIKTKEE